MRAQPFLISLCALVLTACSSTQSVDHKIDPPLCQLTCSSNFAAFPYIQLKENETINLDIDGKSPVGQFTAGNSHFGAFRLNERSAESQVTISGLMINDSVFAPEVHILTPDFQVAETFTLDQFDILPSDAFTRTRFVLRTNVDVAKTPYFIVYTDASRLGEHIQVEHPARRRAKEFGEVMPMVTDPRYIHQPTGKIEIQIKSLKLQSMNALGTTLHNSQQGSTSPLVTVLPETKQYFFSAIQQAVANDDLDSAMALVAEASALNIPEARDVFIDAVRSTTLQ
ncbi:MalM family protein [Vibrio ulleungensis]|uniref:Transcriptional regulator n=1 Tax=Vibrio ulleungensis TaxID=2807619 RepID=A0ABS2HG46_9VIBR|nr:MalM family protein [Vibrio ulleungensis]MBM7036071.1 transcriptional regulator [Vibrio ulleungensis]